MTRKPGSRRARRRTMRWVATASSATTSYGNNPCRGPGVDALRLDPLVVDRFAEIGLSGDPRRPDAWRVATHAFLGLRRIGRTRLLDEFEPRHPHVAFASPDADAGAPGPENFARAFAIGCSGRAPA